MSDSESSSNSSLNSLEEKECIFCGEPTFIVEDLNQYHDICENCCSILVNKFICPHCKSHYVGGHCRCYLDQDVDLSNEERTELEQARVYSTEELEEIINDI